jgi:hypothetical protein
MKSITWLEFVKLIGTGKYNHGYAVSDEGSSGIFEGPISSITAGKESASVSVSPCLLNGKLFHQESYTISAFGYDGTASPGLGEDGVISYYLYLIGNVMIYPQDHPVARGKAA